MKIVILAKNRERYRSGYYHEDWIRAFRKYGECYVYGEGYPDYDPRDTIEDVFAKSPFEKGQIDLIVVGTSWENEDEDNPESDPHPNIKLGHLDIPHIFLLNKEYKKLEAKLRYAVENRFDLVCTVHHDYEKWAQQTGLRFLQVPFAANPERFRDFGLPKRYDFGFTGGLHTRWTDIRYRVKELLFVNPQIKTNLSLARPFKQNPIKPQFRKYRIYWAEWGAGVFRGRDLLGRRVVPFGPKYAKLLNMCKSFLCTPSAIGIIGTRFFECMATKALILCPRSGHYGDLLKDSYNCLMFEPDLSDFTEKLDAAAKGGGEIKHIVETAYKDFLKKHTYEHRVRTILRELKFV